MSEVRISPLIRQLVAENPHKLKVLELPFYFSAEWLSCKMPDNDDMDKRHPPIKPVFNRPGVYYFRYPTRKKLAVAWVELEDGTARSYHEDNVRQVEYELAGLDLYGIRREEIHALFKIMKGMSRKCRHKIFTTELLQRLHRANNEFITEDVGRDAQRSAAKFRKEWKNKEKHD